METTPAARADLPPTPRADLPPGFPAMCWGAGIVAGLTVVGCAVLIVTGLVSDQDLALVLTLIGAVWGIPALLALVAVGLAVGLRIRSPRVATGLVVTAMVLTAFGLLAAAGLLLPGL